MWSEWILVLMGVVAAEERGWWLLLLDWCSLGYLVAGGCQQPLPMFNLANVNFEWGYGKSSIEVSFLPTLLMDGFAVQSSRLSCPNEPLKLNYSTATVCVYQVGAYAFIRIGARMGMGIGARASFEKNSKQLPYTVSLNRFFSCNPLIQTTWRYHCGTKLWWHLGELEARKGIRDDVTG